MIFYNEAGESFVREVDEDHFAEVCEEMMGDVTYIVSEDDSETYVYPAELTLNVIDGKVGTDKVMPILRHILRDWLDSVLCDE